MKDSKDNLTLHVEGYPLLDVVPFLILTLRIKLTWLTLYFGLNTWTGMLRITFRLHNLTTRKCKVPLIRGNYQQSSRGRRGNYSLPTLKVFVSLPKGMGGCAGWPRKCSKFENIICRASGTLIHVSLVTDFLEFSTRVPYTTCLGWMTAVLSTSQTENQNQTKIKPNAAYDQRRPSDD